MMTTTAPRVKEVIEMLRKEGLNTPIVTGGASMNEKLARDFGADYYARTAIDGLKILRSLMNDGNEPQRDFGRIEKKENR